MSIEYNIMPHGQKTIYLGTAVFFLQHFCVFLKI